MKKYIIMSIIALVAIVAGVNVHQTNGELKLTDLALSNVEALATPETDEEFNEATGCHATICKSDCVKNGVTHSPASEEKCKCSYCS